MSNRNLEQALNAQEMAEARITQLKENTNMNSNKKKNEARSPLKYIKIETKQKISQ